MRTVCHNAHFVKSVFVDFFQTRLKELMSSRKLTQVALAALCDTTHSTVNRWLNGSKPRGSMARRLCAALCVAPEWLFGGEGEMAAAPLGAAQYPSILVRVVEDHPAAGLATFRQIVADLETATGEKRLSLLTDLAQIADVLLRLERAKPLALTHSDP